MNKRNLWFKFYLLALPCLFSPAFSIASPVKGKVMLEIPQTNVEGTVVDPGGRPLAGATIRVARQETMTSTDANGHFVLAVSEGQVLSISYTGYHSKEVEATPGQNMLITLMEDAAALDEVVVVGYSAQRRSSVTGAVASVNMSDLETRRVPNVAQSLQGQVAGVQITQTSGAPGDGINVRIRGEGTIGNNNPLYVVDGVPSRDITFLNPSDIESMSVLKDASAAAIYGSRASAGVIVITTKQGGAGKSSLNINYFGGLQQVNNLPKLLNTTQYLDVLETSWNNSGNTGENPYTKDKSRTDLANTDWLDELFETGKTNSVELA